MRIPVTEETKNKVVELTKLAMAHIRALQLIDEELNTTLVDAVRTLDIEDKVEAYDYETHEFVLRSEDEAVSGDNQL